MNSASIHQLKLMVFGLVHNNIMCDNEGRMRIVDIGTYFSGDSITPYGEFMAHTLHTPLWEHFSRYLGKDIDMKRVHLYALISNMYVLSFVAKYVGGDLKKVKPWGNTRTFLELIDEHKEILRG